ncbi:aromatic-ring-hydroxylating dioxygenase subunit beta [Nocardioides humi]|uniref:Aromatic-ring-hydroxylating dioxygenase subunit beta n=1 Tax=Nocardioides humi TaxID=449461 RepID=A0ABN2BQZ7_9ACTN|nr:aromatic-ring-hydroxylating dioxygenase subunit beta [Nocardioides humi]
MSGPTPGASGRELRAEMEEFLFHEADLLDRWQLMEWLELFTLDCRYVVPSTDRPDGDPTRDLVLVHDDRFMLEQRATSLLTRSAHAEYPHSRTRRLVGNVRVVERPGELDVRANFILTRSRSGVVDTYVGRYEHRLVREGAELRFRERRAILDLDALSPQGKLSVIL